MSLLGVDWLIRVLDCLLFFFCHLNCSTVDIPHSVMEMFKTLIEGRKFNLLGRLKICISAYYLLYALPPARWLGLAEIRHSSL